VLDKVPVILQRAGLLRGTIAVLITGGLMLLLAVVMLVGLRGLGSGPQASVPALSASAPAVQSGNTAPTRAVIGVPTAP
jgi:hypothetical protein